MRMKLILAEDHVLVRQGLKSLLEREGFLVVGEASDGPEAVRLAERTCPEIAILDVSMPNLNGVDSARELGKLPKPPRIILLSQHDENQYVIEALRVGVRG